VNIFKEIEIDLERFILKWKFTKMGLTKGWLLLLNANTFTVRSMESQECHQKKRYGKNSQMLVMIQNCQMERSDIVFMPLGRFAKKKDQI